MNNKFKNKKLMNRIITSMVAFLVIITVIFLLIIEKYNSNIYEFSKDLTSGKNEEIIILEYDTNSKDLLAKISNKETDSLTFKNCFISDLDEINELNNLKTIEFIDCNIEFKKTDEKIANNSVEKLIIDGCDIDNARDFFDFFENAENINVHRSSVEEELKIDNKKIENLTINNCNIHSILLKSDKIQRIELKNNSIEKIEDLDIPYQTREINLRDNPINNLDGIEKITNLESLDIRGTNIKSVKNLSSLEYFCEIYIDRDVNREQLSFMNGEFRDADVYTKRFFLEKRYNLN